MELDYDKILDEWADQIYKKVENYRKQIEDIDDYTYKKGRLSGYADGLILAICMLNRIEQKTLNKAKKKI